MSLCHWEKWNKTKQNLSWPFGKARGVLGSGLNVKTGGVFWGLWQSCAPLFLGDHPPQAVLVKQITIFLGPDWEQKDKMPSVWVHGILSSGLACRGPGPWVLWFAPGGPPNSLSPGTRDTWMYLQIDQLPEWQLCGGQVTGQSSVFYWPGSVCGAWLPAWNPRCLWSHQHPCSSVGLKVDTRTCHRPQQQCFLYLWLLKVFLPDFIN